MMPKYMPNPLSVKPYFPLLCIADALAPASVWKAISGKLHA